MLGDNNGDDASVLWNGDGIILCMGCVEKMKAIGWVITLMLIAWVILV